MEKKWEANQTLGTIAVVYCSRRVRLGPVQLFILETAQLKSGPVEYFILIFGNF